MAVVAERPIRFYSSLSIENETMPMIQLPSELLWASVELMKNMAIGHDVEALTQFFSSMNISDSHALFHAMSSAASFGNSLTPPTSAKAHTLSTFPLPATETDAETFVAESLFWDMETGIASFRTTFDPVSRRRCAIIANSRQAAFYGVHPEEFQVLISAHSPQQ